MYERFSELLQNYGVTAYKVSKETGVSQQTLSDWKKGKSTPKLDKLKKIADYFNVPLDYLTGNDNIVVEANNEPIYLDEETRAIIDTLRTRPEMKILFSVSKNATPDDIRLAVEMIQKFKKDSE